MPTRLPTPPLITSPTPTWQWSQEARKVERSLARPCFGALMVLNLAGLSALRLHVITDPKPY